MIIGVRYTDASRGGLCQNPSTLFSANEDGLGCSAFMQKFFPQRREYLNFLRRLDDLDTVFDVRGNGVGVADAQFML